MDGLEQLGATMLTPRDIQSRAGIVTARFPGRNGEGVAARLNEAGVIVSPRFGSTRFSTHIFNHAEDVDHAISVVERVLDRSGSRMQG
jgi:selenocysteine lyase/cysteine desulfurase